MTPEQEILSVAEALLLEDQTPKVLKQLGPQLQAAFDEDGTPNKERLIKPPRTAAGARVIPGAAPGLRGAVPAENPNQQPRPGADVVDFFNRKLGDLADSYMPWVARAYSRREFRLEDMERVVGTFTGWDVARRRMVNKDIGQFKTFTDLFTAVDRLRERTPEEKAAEQVGGQEREKTQALLRDGGAELIHRDPTLIVIKLKTKEASQWFGRGTHWCTAWTNREPMFASYNSQGPLYIIIADGKKYQWHNPSNQMKGSSDNELDADGVVKLINEHPGIGAMLGMGTDKAWAMKYRPNSFLLFPDVSEDDIVKALEAGAEGAGYGRYGSKPLFQQIVNSKGQQSERVNLVAVKASAANIKFIKNPSEAVQAQAVKTDPATIKDIAKPTEKVMMAAVTSPKAKSEDRNDGPARGAPEWVPLMSCPGASPAVIKAAIENNGWNIKAVPNPSPELQKLAASHTPWAIQAINPKALTTDIAREAVQKNGLVLQTIPAGDVFRDVFEDAVRQNGMALLFVPKGWITEPLALLGVTSNGMAIQYVPKALHTPAVMDAALEHDPQSIQFIPKPEYKHLMAAASPKPGKTNAIWHIKDRDLPPEIRMAAIKSNPVSFTYFKDPSEAEQLAAVKANPWMLYYIRRPTKEMQLAAVSRNGYALQYAGKEKDPDVCLAAVARDGGAIRHVPERLRTPEIRMAAVRSDGAALKHLKNPTPTEMDAAVRSNGMAIKYVPTNLYGDGAGGTGMDLLKKAVAQTGYALRAVPAPIGVDTQDAEMQRLAVQNIPGSAFTISKEGGIKAWSKPLLNLPTPEVLALAKERKKAAGKTKPPPAPSSEPVEQDASSGGTTEGPAGPEVAAPNAVRLDQAMRGEALADLDDAATRLFGYHPGPGDRSAKKAEATGDKAALVALLRAGPRHWEWTRMRYSGGVMTIFLVCGYEFRWDYLWRIANPKHKLQKWANSPQLFDRYMTDLALRNIDDNDGNFGPDDVSFVGGTGSVDEATDPGESRMVKLDLARRFGTSAAIGEKPEEEDREAQFLDGSAQFICTNWARHVVDALGPGRVRICGYYDEDNPGAAASDGNGGHDFAIVDEQFIVDGWVFDFAGTADRPVYDMLDPADADDIRRLYGDPEKWERGAIEEAVKWWPPASTSRPTPAEREWLERRGWAELPPNEWRHPDSWPIYLTWDEEFATAPAAGSRPGGSLYGWRALFRDTEGGSHTAVVAGQDLQGMARSALRVAKKYNRRQWYQSGVPHRKSDPWPTRIEATRIPRTTVYRVLLTCYQDFNLDLTTDHFGMAGRPYLPAGSVLVDMGPGSLGGRKYWVRVKTPSGNHSLEISGPGEKKMRELVLRGVLAPVLMGEAARMPRVDRYRVIQDVWRLRILPIEARDGSAYYPASRWTTEPEGFEISRHLPAGASLRRVGPWGGAINFDFFLPSGVMDDSLVLDRSELRWLVRNGSLVPDIVGEAAITELPPVSNDREALGWVPWNGEIDYRGFRVLMHPEKFLDLVDPKRQDGARSSDQILALLKKGKKIAPPFLQVEVPEAWIGDTPNTPSGEVTGKASRFDLENGMAKIFGHEGRNRMYALVAGYGGAPVEVHILPVERRARHMTPEIVAELNKGCLSQTGDWVDGPLWMRVLTSELEESAASDRKWLERHGWVELPLGEWRHSDSRPYYLKWKPPTEEDAFHAESPWVVCDLSRMGNEEVHAYGATPKRAADVALMYSRRHPRNQGMFDPEGPYDHKDPWKFDGSWPTRVESTASDQKQMEREGWVRAWNDFTWAHPDSNPYLIQRNAGGWVILGQDGDKTHIVYGPTKGWKHAAWTAIRYAATMKSIPRMDRWPARVESSGRITLYHVCLTSAVPSIKKKGLLMMQPSNWVQAGNKERYGKGEVYAFEHRDDAIRWAGRWDWSLHQKTGSGKVSIVSFEADPSGWSEDDADPIAQAGKRGRWLKRTGGVPAADVTGAEPVLAKGIRDLVRRDREGYSEAADVRAAGEAWLRKYFWIEGPAGQWKHPDSNPYLVKWRDAISRPARVSANGFALPARNEKAGWAVWCSHGDGVGIGITSGAYKNAAEAARHAMKDAKAGYVYPVDGWPARVESSGDRPPGRDLRWLERHGWAEFRKKGEWRCAEFEPFYMEYDPTDADGGPPWAVGSHFSNIFYYYDTPAKAARQAERAWAGLPGGADGWKHTSDRSGEPLDDLVDEPPDFAEAVEAILVEGRADDIAERQGPKVWSSAGQDRSLAEFIESGDFPDALSVVKGIEDRMGPREYLQWAVNRYIAREFMWEDLSRLRRALEGFDRVRTRLVNKDVNQYKHLSDLEDAVENLSDKPAEKSNREQEKDKTQSFFRDGAAELLHRDPNLIVIVPKRKDASCWFGRGTRWCTAAASSANYFDRYNARGPLYIVIASGKKYQFHSERAGGHIQHADDQDRPIGAGDGYGLFRDHPELPGLLGIRGNWRSAALALWPDAVIFTQDATDDEMVAALGKTRDPSLIKGIRNPTDAMKWAALHNQNTGHEVFRYIKDPTPEMVELALKANPSNIVYVKNATDQQLKTALSGDPLLLSQMDPGRRKAVQAAVLHGLANKSGWRRSEEVMRALVEPESWLIKSVLQVAPHAIAGLADQTPEYQMVALRAEADAQAKRPNASSVTGWWDELVVVGLIRSPTPEAQLYSVQNNPLSIAEIEDPTTEAQLAAARVIGPGNLRYIAKTGVLLFSAKANAKRGGWRRGQILLLKKTAPEVVEIMTSHRSSAKGALSSGGLEAAEAAVRADPKLIATFADPPEPLQMAAVVADPSTIRLIKKPTEIVMAHAIDGDPGIFQYIKNPTPRIILSALRARGANLRFVKKPTREQVLVAVKKDGRAVQFAPAEFKSDMDVAMAAVKQNGDSIRFLEGLPPYEDIHIQRAAIRNVYYVRKLVLATDGHVKYAQMNRPALIIVPRTSPNIDRMREYAKRVRDAAKAGRDLPLEATNDLEAAAMALFG